MTKLVGYEHPRLGFILPVPDAWERLVDAGVTPLIVVEPTETQRFRANVVVNVQELPVGATAEQWQERSIEALRRQLNGYWTIDREITTAGTQQVSRVLGHHNLRFGSVTIELWSRCAPPYSYTIAASVGTLQYPARCELFAEMANGLRLSGEAR